MPWCLETDVLFANNFYSTYWFRMYEIGSQQSHNIFCIQMFPSCIKKAKQLIFKGIFLQTFSRLVFWFVL